MSILPPKAPPTGVETTRTFGDGWQQKTECLGKPDRERGYRCDTGQPHHPPDLEPNQRSKGLSGIEISAAGLVKIARRLRETEDDQENSQTCHDHRCQAGRSKNRGRRGRKEINAAPDDIVEREGDDVPA